MAKKFDMSKAMGDTGKKKIITKSKDQIADEAATKIHASTYRRTTVHIEKDVFVKIATMAAVEETSFKVILNRTLKRGLKN